MIETDTLAAPRAPARTAGIEISLEAMIYVLLVTLALALRLYDLGWMPLDQRESAAALAAWRASQGQAFGALPVAPLLFQLQAATFWLLPGGDAVARLVPALAGSLLVVAAAGLRPLLGRPSALAAAAVFAVSPLWVFLGRNLSEATLSTLLVVLLLGLLARGGRSAGLWAPVVAALALAAGGVTVTFGVAALVAWLALRGQRAHHEAFQRLTAPWSEPADRRRAAILFAVTLALAATGLLLRPEGFAGLVQLPAAWAAQAAQGTGPLLGLALPLLAYAPVTLAFGLAGLVPAWSRGTVFGQLLVIWLAVGWVAALLAGPATLVDLFLPLSLAAALALGGLAEALHRSFQWREEGVMATILLVVGAYCLVTAFGAVGTVQGMEVAQRQLVGGLVVAGVLVVVYLALWGRATTLRVLGIVWLILGGLLAWAGGTALAYRPALALVEPMRPSFVTPDAARLAEDLASVSQARHRDPAAIVTAADPQLEPVLAWRLRGLRDLTWTDATADTDAEAVVTARQLANEEPAEIGPDPYLGRSYRVSGSFLPSFLAAGAFDPWLFLRWLLWHEPSRDLTRGGNVQFDQASLYLNVDSEVKP